MNGLRSTYKYYLAEPDWNYLLRLKMPVRTNAALMVNPDTSSWKALWCIPASRRIKPTANWVSFEMVGEYGWLAAAAQSSFKGVEDM